MKLQLALVLSSIAVVSIVSSSIETTQQVYCGRRLAMALALMCGDDDMGKRSYNSLSEHRIQHNYEEDDWPWIIKTRAFEGLRGKRQGQGVASECCDKPCSLNELLSYC